ncbi:MAG: restriction endonuclease subunit S [Paludibacter sp.]|nr:restriction endonuclease subunit S [Paludibacter sp.]
MKFGLEVQVIENIISVLEQHPKVDKAFVFGSRAKGNYRPDSDIDIAIKGNEITTDDIIAISVAIETKGITHKFDLIDYNSIKEPALKEHIDRVGIEFYSRWQELKLGTVLEIKYGKDHKQLNEGNIPVYGSGGIMRFGDKALYDKKSILIPRKGSLNNIFYKDEPFWTVDTMFWSKIDEGKVFPKFLFYQLTTVDYSNLNVGSAVPSLTVPVIEAIDISLPPLSEQTAIASILSSLDDKIDLLQRQNKTLEQLAETLFRQWFVEEVEESWETKTLGELLTITSSKRIYYSEYVSAGIPFYRSKEIIELRKTGSTNSELFISNERFNEINNKFGSPKEGDILMTSVGTLGVAYRVRKSDNFYFKDGNLTWFKDFKGLPSSIVYLWLISKIGQEELAAITIGSTQEALTIEGLKSISFKIPPTEKVKIYELEFNSIIDKIESNQTQIRTLTQIRDTMLPKLMSGEVRVEM